MQQPNRVWFLLWHIFLIVEAVTSFSGGRRSSFRRTFSLSVLEVFSFIFFINLFHQSISLIYFINLFHQSIPSIYFVNQFHQSIFCLAHLLRTCTQCLFDSSNETKIENIDKKKPQETSTSYFSMNMSISGKEC